MDISKGIFDSTIKRTVYLEKLSAELKNKVVTLLNQAQKSIVNEIVKVDPTSVAATRYRQERLANLGSRIDTILKGTYSKANKILKSDLQKLAVLESKATGIAVNKLLGADLFNVTLTNEYLKSIVENTLIEGQTVKKWFDAQAQNMSQRVNRALAKEVHSSNLLQLGMVKGESIGKLVTLVRGTKTAVDGVGFNLSRKDATVLVRTSVLQVANQARAATYQANEDLMNGYQIVATLDTRTCSECMALDGVEVGLDWGEEGGPPPFHMQCRCTFVPVLKSYKQLIDETTPTSVLDEEVFSDLTEGQTSSATDALVSADAYRGYMVGMQDSAVVDSLNAVSRFGYDSTALEAASQKVISNYVPADLAGYVNDSSLKDAKRILDMIESKAMQQAIYKVETVIESDIAKTIQKLKDAGEVEWKKIMSLTKKLPTDEVAAGERRIIYKIQGNKKALDISALAPAGQEGKVLTFGRFKVMATKVPEAGDVTVTLKQLPRITSVTQSGLSRSQIKLLDTVPEGVRASMGGPVPGKMTYNEWLLTQPEALQKDILGQTKWRIWKEKGLRLEDMVDQSGKPMTIRQLEIKYGELAPEVSREAQAIPTGEFGARLGSQQGLMDELIIKGRSFNEIVEELKLKPTRVSGHLRVLQQNGFITFNSKTKEITILRKVTPVGKTTLVPTVEKVVPTVERVIAPVVEKPIPIPGDKAQAKAEYESWVAKQKEEKALKGWSYSFNEEIDKSYINYMTYMDKAEITAARRDMIREMLRVPKKSENFVFEEALKKAEQGARYIPSDVLYKLQRSGRSLRFEKKTAKFRASYHPATMEMQVSFTSTTETIAHEFSHGIDHMWGGRGGFEWTDSAFATKEESRALKEEFYSKRSPQVNGVWKQGTYRNGDGKYWIGNYIDNYEARIYPGSGPGQEWWAMNAQRYNRYREVFDSYEVRLADERNILKDWIAQGQNETMLTMQRREIAGLVHEGPEAYASRMTQWKTVRTYYPVLADFMEKKFGQEFISVNRAEAARVLEATRLAEAAKVEAARLAAEAEKAAEIFREVERVKLAEIEAEKLAAKTNPEIRKDLEGAIARKNVEPDGKIWGLEGPVDATPEEVKAKIERTDRLNSFASADGVVRTAEERIREYEWLIVEGKGDDVAAIRKIAVNDSRLVSAKEAIEQEKWKLEDTRQYIQDVRLAGEAYKRGIVEQLAAAEKVVEPVGKKEAYDAWQSVIEKQGKQVSLVGRMEEVSAHTKYMSFLDEAELRVERKSLLEAMSKKLTPKQADLIERGTNYIPSDVLSALKSNGYTFRMSKDITRGQFHDGAKYITLEADSAPSTIAHEFGHAIDHLFSLSGKVGQRIETGGLWTSDTLFGTTAEGNAFRADFLSHTTGKEVSYGGFWEGNFIDTYEAKIYPGEGVGHEWWAVNCERFSDYKELLRTFDEEITKSGGYWLDKMKELGREAYAGERSGWFKAQRRYPQLTKLITDKFDRKFTSLGSDRELTSQAKAVLGKGGIIEQSVSEKIMAKIKPEGFPVQVEEGKTYRISATRKRIYHDPSVSGGSEKESIKEVEILKKLKPGDYSAKIGDKYFRVNVYVDENNNIVGMRMWKGGNSPLQYDISGMVEKTSR